MNASGIWTFNTRKDENHTDTTETKNRQAATLINQVRKRFANYEHAKVVVSPQLYALAIYNSRTQAQVMGFESMNKTTGIN